MPVEKWPYFGRKLWSKREKVQPVTENVVSEESNRSYSTYRTYRTYLTRFVLIEENLEVASHVGLVEGVFGSG